MISVAVANAANPYAIWVFAYYEIFDSAVEYLEEISDPKLGSVEEALMSALGTATNLYTHRCIACPMTEHFAFLLFR